MPLRPALLLPAVLFVLAAAAGPAPAATRAALDSKRTCVYPKHQRSILREFSTLVGRSPDCVVVYNDASPDWAGWEHPWFLRHRDPNFDWKAWATAPGTRRRLIVTQNLFPSGLKDTAWREPGARGAYAGHARTLARNLVAAGVGDATIRLAHEANGTWYPNSIGDTPREHRLWRQFWRRTVQAMRSVPGARFRFDWTVNAAWRPIPLHLWYPGDDVVDIVGIDAYDSGIKEQTGRWATVYSRTLGVRDLLRFARRHRKPLSIPEWGIAPVGHMLSGGDNPAYVEGIARIVRRERVAYQAYFYGDQWRTQLRTSPRSLAAYRRWFGRRPGR